MSAAIETTKIPVEDGPNREAGQGQSSQPVRHPSQDNSGAVQDARFWQTHPHPFHWRGLSYFDLIPGPQFSEMCDMCGLKFDEAIHLKAGAADAAPENFNELVVADQILTCPACSRVMPADDDRVLPVHKNVMDELFETESGNCPGSNTKGQSHRMLPEAPALTFIEFVEDPHNGNERDAHLDRNAKMMTDSIHFLCAWLGPQEMPTDQTSLVRVAGHANNIQQAALNLLNRPAMSRANGQRRRV